MSGGADLRARLLLELVNRLSGPARQAAADMRGLGAAARSIQGAATGRLQQELRQTGAAAVSARASLAGAGAAAREIGRSSSATPLQFALAGVAQQAKSAQGSLGNASTAARDLSEAFNNIRGTGAKNLQRDLLVAARAARMSAEELAAVAGAANRLARVGPGQALRRDLAAAAREARKTNDALAALTRGVQRLEHKGPGQTLRRDLAQVAREARRADDALTGVGDKARKLDQANAIATMRRNLAGVAAEADRARQALAGVNTEAGKAPRQSAAGVGSATDYAPADDGGGSVLALGRRALLAGGAAYAAREVVRGTVGQSISFDAAMADVKKKVDLPEGRSRAEIEREIDKAALKYGRSRDEVAAMTANLGASGIGFSELPEYIAMTIGTGVAWDMTADDASQRLMEARAGNGWDAQQLRDYGDKVNALGDASNALERNIAEMFGRASGGAAAAGVPTDVALAGLTALNSVGVQPEIASRFFSQFAAKLATAGSDDPKKWAAAGLDNKAVTKGMRTDSFSTMVNVLDQISSKANAAELAVEIFGEGWWDEAMRLQRAIPEWRRLKEILDDPGKWRGSQQSALNVELATTQNHLDRLWAAASKVGDALGRWTLAPINNVVDSLVKGVDSLNDRATIFDAWAERYRAAAAIAAGQDVTGGTKGPIDLPNKPVIDIKGETETEKKLVQWLSGGKSDRAFVSQYFHDMVFGREGGKDQRLMDARVDAWMDHMRDLDRKAERALAEVRGAQDKIAKLKYEREQLLRAGADTGLVDWRIDQAEGTLAARQADANAATSARDDESRKATDDSIRANRARELVERSKLLPATKKQFFGLPPAPLTRNLPDNNYLKADGLPAVVGGFAAKVSGHGVQAGYTEKPAPRLPTRGWRVSKDDAGGFELPPPAPVGRFGLGAGGFVPQPQIPGAAGVAGATGGRAAGLQSFVAAPDIGPTIMDQIATGIEAGKPQVESASRGVGDSVRNALHGADLAGAGQAAMSSYAASISAGGAQAVAAARAVAAQVRSELTVSAPAPSIQSPRGRLGGALHDIPTGGP